MKASPWAWVAGVALLLGAGFAIGYWASRDSDLERQVWDTRTDSLIGAALTRHRATLDSAASLVAAAEQRAERAMVIANAEREAKLLARASEKSLRLELAAAEERGDSAAMYRAAAALLPVVTARADAAEGEAKALRTTIAEQRQAAGAWAARAANDSSRIAELEAQLEATPKPASACRVLGVPCPEVFVGVGVTSGTGTAAGITVAVGIPIRRK